MKKRDNIMFIPPMILLAMIWSPISYAVEAPAEDQTPKIFQRSLAVDEDNQETYVTKPEDIDTKVIVEEDQKTIEEVTEEVVSDSMKVEEVKDKKEEKVEEEVVAVENEKDAEEVAITETTIDKDQVTCKEHEEKKTIVQEVKSQERDIMKEFNDFLQAVMVPMMANYISGQSFQAPPVQTGFTGIPAGNTNHTNGLGLNLLSLSDYYNARSMGSAGSTGTTINNYNVTGDFYNGAYNPMAGNQLGIETKQQFNPLMSQTMFNSATASPFGFNFGGLAVKDHSRFEQLNAQNIQAPIAFTPQQQPTLPTTAIQPTLPQTAVLQTQIPDQRVPTSTVIDTGTKSRLVE